MIFLKEDEFGEMKSYVSENHLVADLISQLYEEIQICERRDEMHRKELEKAQKKVKQLQKKLGMFNILKEK